MSAAAESKGWIRSPAFDLGMFGFAWIPVLLAFVLVDLYFPKMGARGVILATVLIVSALHRHLTFPLVYADRDQFQQRRWAYIIAPIVFIGLTILALLLYNVFPLMMILIVASALWNFYHTLMQKMGILRIYSRKAGPSRAWVDKAMIFSWFAALFFLLGSMPKVVHKITTLALSGRYLVKALTPVLQVFPYVAAVAVAISLVITVLYLIQEIKNENGFHVPKNLFMASIMALYGLFFYDFFVAYVAFGFSHAVEYIAFVNVYAGKKYKALPEKSSWMAHWMRHQALSAGIYCGVILLLFVPWYLYSKPTYGYYILGTSFLHFLYDGWIWKMRKRSVGAPLGISYPASGASVAPSPASPSAV